MKSFASYKFSLRHSSENDMMKRKNGMVGADMAYSNYETGRRVKRLRLDLKMTMDDLAEKIGYTSKSKKTIIYQIETGNNEIKLSRLLTASSALQTNIYYLLGLTDVSDISDEDIVKLIEQYGRAESAESSEAE